MVLLSIGWARPINGPTLSCAARASTVCELAVAAKPAIFVPYPFHKDHQQLRNANWLRAAGAAEVIEQHELDVDQLDGCLPH